MSTEVPPRASPPSLGWLVVVGAIAFALAVVIGLNVIYRETQGFNVRGAFEADAVAFGILSVVLPLVWWVLKLRARWRLAGTAVVVAVAAAAWLAVPVYAGASLMSLAGESTALVDGFRQVTPEDVAGFAKLTTRLENFETATCERFEPVRVPRENWLAAARGRLDALSEAHPLTAEGFTALQADFVPYRAIGDLSHHCAAVVGQFTDRRLAAFGEAVRALQPDDLDGFRRLLPVGQAVFLDHYDRGPAVFRVGSAFLVAARGAAVRPDGDPAKGAAARRARLVAFRDAVAGLPPLAGQELNDEDGRKKICRAALDAARWELRPRIERDDYAGMVALVKSLDREWGKEATATGLEKDLLAMFEACEYMAELDRRSRAAKAKE